MAKNSLIDRQAKTAQRILRSLTMLLSLQFVLGITLTTLINYNPSKRSAVQTTFLVLHIIVAFGLLSASAVQLVMSIRWRSLVLQSVAIALSIIGAMVAGIIAASTGNDVAVFVMAMFFLSAFGAIGYSMSATKQ